MSVAKNDYKVVLLGFNSGKGEYYIEKEFAELFKISHDKAKSMFRSTPKVIRKNLSLVDAQRYEKAINQTGAQCEVENMNYDLSGLSLD